MIRKGVVVLTFIIILNLFTGCWSRRELNELGIATAIGIDKDENNYFVSVQMVNPGEISSRSATGQRATVVTYRASGKTVMEALRRVTISTPRRIYLSHLRVIVFGREVAEDGLTKAVDFLSRNHEMRVNIYVVVAKNAKAEEILDIQTPIEKIAANKIYGSLENSDELWASTHAVRLDELINSMASSGKEAVITGLALKGSHEIGMSKENLEKIKISTVMQTENLGVLKEDKLVGWFDEQQSIGFNNIVGNTKSTATTISYPEDGNISMNVLRTKASMKANIEDGKPKIKVLFKAEGNLGSVQSDIDLTKIETIIELEKLFEKHIKSQMDSAVLKAQKDFKSDVFGFGEEIHRTYPKEWNKLEKNWGEEFSKLKVETEAVVNLRGVGTITNPIRTEIEE